MKVEQKIKIVEAAFEWCVQKFGSPLKSYDANLIIKTDRRIKRFCGEYENRNIYVYLNTCNTLDVLVKTVVHEYCHFIQMPKIGDLKKYHRLIDKFSYTYENHPYEVDARQWEITYGEECIKELFS